MFLLNKWYLDLTTADGTVVICYAARLRWGPVRTRFASVLLAPPGARPDEAVSVRHVERPRVDDGVVSWHSTALDLHGEWHRLQPAIRQTLLRDHTGAIRWSCRMPLAAAELRWGSRRFTGLGYVESLGMTLPPTQLPFHTLRWGRHLSPEHSLVWIDWSGDVSGQWVWLDGIRQHDVTFGDDGSIQLPGGQRLELHDSREIRSHSVLPSLVTVLPGVAQHMAGSLAILHEHKMVARSALHRGAMPLDSGWTVHEIVAC